MKLAAHKLTDSKYVGLFDDLILPEVPPRTVNRLLSLLREGNGNLISILEWINLFDTQDLLADFNINDATQLKNLIWENIRKNSSIRHIALWRMCLYFDSNRQVLPARLLSNYKNDLETLLDIDGQKAKIVLAIADKSPELLARYSLKSSLKPEHLLIKFGLPFKLSIAKSATSKIEEVLAKINFHKYEQNYLKILEGYSLNDRDHAVVRLINKITTSTIEKSNYLLDFIKNNYAPTAANTRWSHLCLETQQKLRELLGAAWFGDFKKFIFQITTPKIAQALRLEDREIKQLKSRVTFWSNYQSRFHSFKIFLPLKTATIIRNLGVNIPEHSIVSGFLDDRKETELCVLEFDNYLIVEHLRGGSSGVTFYEKSELNKDVLLNNGELKVRDLNMLSFEFEHDHLIFWQNSCEHLLRNVLGITPDKSKKQFLIVDSDKSEERFYQKYDRKSGLPPLSQEKQRKRADALKSRKQNRASYNNTKGTLSSGSNAQSHSKPIERTSARTGFLGLREGIKVIHLSRYELGEGKVTKLYDNGRIDVQFNGESFSGVRADTFRLVE